MVATSRLLTNGFSRLSPSLQNGLIGWWTFDDGFAKDYSGFNNNGALAGTARPTPVAGIVPGIGAPGGALTFNGTTSHVDTALNPAGLTAFAFSAWVYHNVATAGQRVCANSHTDSDNNGFQIITGAYQFTYGNGITFGGSNPGTVFATKQWDHILCTFDSTGSVMYKNGAQVAVGGAIAGPMTAGTNGISFGFNPNYLGDFFNGRLDDVRIYNRLLNASEALELWFMGRQAFDEPNMLAMYLGAAASGVPSGTLAATETPDTAAFTGTVADQGALAATEAADVAAFTGTVADQGSLAATETPDTAAFAGTFSDQGTLAATEAADTAAFTGTVADQGSLAATETPDVAAFSGNTVVSGTLAATEAADVAAFSGTFGNSVSGTLAATETPDTAAFAGTVADQGALAAQEAPDAAAFTGNVDTAGTLAATEAPDVAAFAGTVADQGSLTVTETADTAAFTGALSDQGALIATESADVAAFTGNFAGLASGTLVATETPDVAAFSGSVVNPATQFVQTLGDGGHIDHPTEWRRRGKQTLDLRRALREARERLENGAPQALQEIIEPVLNSLLSTTAIVPPPVAEKAIALVADAIAPPARVAPKRQMQERAAAITRALEAAAQAAAQDEEEAIISLLLVA